MAEITAKLVKELREKSGAGVMDPIDGKYKNGRKIN